MLHMHSFMKRFAPVLLLLAAVLGLIVAGTQAAQAQTETVLYSFGSQSGDGANPADSLIMDKKGDLYGTTWAGGAIGDGTVFKLSTPATTGGAWTETVLYSFGSFSGDGFAPWNSGVIMDKEGNLYGTTYSGGANLGGTVFELSPPATTGGAWTETVLYSFCSQASCADGLSPPATA